MHGCLLLVEKFIWSRCKKKEWSPSKILGNGIETKKEASWNGFRIFRRLFPYHLQLTSLELSQVLYSSLKKLPRKCSMDYTVHCSRTLLTLSCVYLYSEKPCLSNMLRVHAYMLLFPLLRISFWCSLKMESWYSCKGFYQTVILHVRSP